MNRKFMALALGAMILTGCSQDDELNNAEQALVTYNVSVGTDAQTRAGGEPALAVNKMICAVFENGTELRRDIVDVDAQGKATYTPALFKNIDYKIVFWAYYTDGTDVCYDMTNLNAIKVNENFDKGVFETDANKDAYTAVEEINLSTTTVSEKSVTLGRPFAQVNVLTTTADWDNAVELKSTPTSTTLTLSGYSDVYNALTGTWSGDASSLSLNAAPDTVTYSIGTAQYYFLASEYVFGNGNATCNIVVKDNNSKEIYTKQVNDMPLNVNTRTNMYGRLLTGDVTYSLSVEKGFSANDKVDIE